MPPPTKQKQKAETPGAAEDKLSHVEGWRQQGETGVLSPSCSAQWLVGVEGGMVGEALQNKMPSPTHPSTLRSLTQQAWDGAWPSAFTVCLPGKAVVQPGLRIKPHHGDLRSLTQNEPQFLHLQSAQICLQGFHRQIPREPSRAPGAMWQARK